MKPQNYGRNAPVRQGSYGRDPYRATNRKRTPESARQRRECMAFNMGGAQVEGSAGGGGTARGDAGYWQRKQRYSAQARARRKTAGAQQGIGGIPGSPRRKRRRG